MNILDWAPGLCYRLGIDEPGDVDLALGMWAQTEGMPDSANNVLAATDTVRGSHTYNSAGVQAYPSIGVMLDVYARKLTSGRYRGVFDALDNGTILDIYHAINRSPWCPHCQGGHYPNVLYQFLVSTGAIAGATFVQLLASAPGQTGPAPEAWDLQLAVARGSLNDIATKAQQHVRNLDSL